MTSESVPGPAMVRLPARSTVKGPETRFTGDVWVDGITVGAEAGQARLATVRFAPGARTAWHRHAHGQTLHVTEGHGVAGTKDGRSILMRPGDTVYTPPGVWHWHGALPSSFMTHLALADTGPDPDATDVDWADLVSDTDYDTATAAAAQESTK